MNDAQSKRLAVSELMDGELDDEAMLALIAELEKDQDAVACWQDFHAIGDAMRDTPCLSVDFNSRFSARLAAEPTILVPQAKAKVKKPTSLSYYVLPLAASFAGVGVVSWLVIGSLNNDSGTGSTPVATLESPPVVVRAELRPDAVRDFLAAHREFSDGAPLQLAADVRPVAATQDIRR